MAVHRLVRDESAAVIAEVALALLLGVGVFAAMDVVSGLTQHWTAAVALAVGCAATTLLVGQRWGVAYALPVAVAVLVGFDWFYFPPTHDAGVPGVADALVIGLDLAVGAVIGQLAARAWRRAGASETARGLLAAEQAALRRIATLVAQGVPPSQIFAAVADELARLFDADAGSIARYEPDGGVTMLAARGPAAIDGPGRPSSSVAAPILVDDRVWGLAAVASARPDAYPADAEGRIAKFAELIATAIVNAETRRELTASRARVVAAADDARRRLERNLHDGIQQRLVALTLELRDVETRVPDELRAELARIGDELSEALDAVREIAQGLHPAVLAEGGLPAAFNTIARRSPIPVSVDVRLAARLPERVEVAAYYVASEALANAAKHAGASQIELRAEAADDTLDLSIRDDGVGGAELGGGSGLIGLGDRVAAIDGSLTVTSPPGEGTLLRVRLPV
jgi:signal transduction histidine kinase